jgi:hypothetical protein
LQTQSADLPLRAYVPIVNAKLTRISGIPNET